MQRKPASTAAAKRHMGRVAALGCICCSMLGYGETPAQVHHIREGRIARSDWLVIPCCAKHHIGAAMSIHMDKEPLLRALGVFSEFDLLAIVLERIAK
jgi:hypothetical protein